MTDTTTDAALVEQIARLLASQHYADRFQKPACDPHVTANVEGNWQIFIPQAQAISYEVERVAVWPKQLTPDLRKVLGLMCFQLGALAHLYQDAGEFVGAGGEPLKHRAEDEQAFMLHKLVGFVFEHGEKWHDALKVDTDRAHKVAAARAKGTA